MPWNFYEQPDTQKYVTDTPIWRGVIILLEESTTSMVQYDWSVNKPNAEGWALAKQHGQNGFILEISLNKPQYVGQSWSPKIRKQRE